MLPVKPLYFREITHLPASLLVHSQKNHDLAYNSVQLCRIAGPAE
jgi:hypothetical protein